MLSTLAQAVHHCLLWLVHVEDRGGGGQLPPLPEQGRQSMCQQYRQGEEKQSARLVSGGDEVLQVPPWVFQLVFLYAITAATLHTVSGVEHQALVFFK